MEKPNSDLSRKDLLQFFSLLIIFILVEALTTRGDYFFSHAGWVDHWHYLGHFENSFLFNPTHIWNYKSSRLVWNWQGGLIFKYLSYPLSNYVIVVYSLTKFWTLFWLVIRQFTSNKKNALFYVAIFMFYPTLKQNGGWYYHNLEASFWWLLSLFVLKLIESERISDKSIFLAGLFAGFAINTNLFFINFLPVFIFLSPDLFNRNKSLIALAFLGIASTVPILGSINVLLGGKFAYYLPMLKMIKVFNGASELWKPLLQSESFKILFSSSLIVLMFFLLSWNVFKRNKKIHYMPVCSATLYTMVVYVYWHFKGIEVLSVDVHNSMLLIMFFLLLVDFGETFFQENIRPMNIFFLFGLAWFSVHYLYNPSQVLTYLLPTNAFNELILVSIFFFLIIVSLYLKQSTYWFISLSLLPYLFSSYRVYPNYFWQKNSCYGQREHDIIFDIKQEMQKITSPMIYKTKGSSAVSSAINYIGMYNSWPEPKNFSEDCHFAVGESNIVQKSTDFHYMAVVKNSNYYDNEKDEVKCKNWNNFHRPVLKKLYQNCNGEAVEFSIWSDQ